MLLYEESKVLERAVGEEAAGVLAKVFERREAVDRTELATKEDVKALELRIQLEIEKIRAEARETESRLTTQVEQTKVRLQADISQLRIDTARDLREMEMRMVIKLGGMLVVGIGLIVTLQRLL